MSGRIARLVTVPDVVGLPFHVARDAASEAGVALANPDPDGPPIGVLAWPGLFYVVRQAPEPGAVLHEWDSVAVEVVRHGDMPDNQATRILPLPPADSAQAMPERMARVDLTDYER
ncbi:PASTA domain-containing protein [Microbacterium sp. F2E]|uniref:PASTA domain-containing protein n=1 Tax=Microbacterium sp. F2E TaxID=2895284 RepID=UPI001E3BB123|nr:PASTA domain-containing protein [Microbacterium sp. F2E]MCC9053541.1 PASTA domain-containing protein [Microbacterium sp. F2E]